MPTNILGIIWCVPELFLFSPFSQIYWECHHPNWRTPSFFRGVGIPPTSNIYQPQLTIGLMIMRDYANQYIGDYLMRSRTFLFSPFSQIYWECHHPNWLSYMFQRGRAQPPTSNVFQNFLQIKRGEFLEEVALRTWIPSGGSPWNALAPGRRRFSAEMGEWNG